MINNTEEKYKKNRRAFIIFCIVMILLFGMIGVEIYRGARKETQQSQLQDSDEDTDYNMLSAESQKLIDPPEQIDIDDRSSYAEDDTLALCQYICFYYDGDRLMASADYRKEGDLFSFSLWEYDEAGNMRREQVENKVYGSYIRSYAYEYDSSGRVVHEESYWNEETIEKNYFRYTDTGCAGVNYSYYNDQYAGGIAPSCSSHTEFVEDGNGNLLCAFQMPSLDGDIPDKVWKMQWAQKNDCIVNRVQCYDRDVWQGDGSRWYQNIETANGEQVNVYEYDSETSGKNQILQLNYEWQREKAEFELTDSFYRARYDGNLLLWQMVYSDGKLTYYSACQYDADGRLQADVEYQDEEEVLYPHAVFHHYVYSEKDKKEQYSYYIQGREFRHSFGYGDNVLLTFDELGTLSTIEMRDAVGNVMEKYEFSTTGRDYGKLQTMYADADEITGEDAILNKMEEEAEAYGFQAGENLAGGTKGSAE
ncbi:MAG: hypothetical protein K2J99_09015 [Lachnospiraceae bacterium]|nr:hypothetical protein [Lachnospiraceae bacterium]